MGTCKGTGKVAKFGDRLRKRSELIQEIMDMKLAKDDKIRKPKIKNRNKPNRHRVHPAKLKGFHPESLQMKSQQPGIHKRFKVDRDGTITNL